VRLHLVRHADAVEPSAWNGDDASRPLTTEGRGQADMLGRHLAAVGFDPDVILSSSRLRAMETARIVGDHVGRPVRIEERLASGFGLRELAALLARAGGPERPLLVGHDPDLSEIASVLTGAELALRKGAIVAIDVEAGLGTGSGRLRWLLSPEVLSSR
jgi:phosphohistidine phosphatase